MVDFSSIEDLVSSAIADESDVPDNILWEPDQILHSSIFRQDVDDPVVGPLPAQGSLLNAALMASGLGGALKLSDALIGDTMTSGLQQMPVPGIFETQEDQDDMLLSLYNTLTEDGTVWQPENDIQSFAPMKTEEETLVGLSRFVNPQPSLQRFTTANAVRVQSVSTAHVTTPGLHNSSSHRFVGGRGITSILNRTPNFGSLPMRSMTATSVSQNSGMLGKELSKREVSRLWKNEDVSWQTVQVNEVASNGVVNAAAASQGLDEEEEEEEDFGQADMFADYKPSKLNIGIKHPDPVVETSSMSSVLPPDVWYKLKLPREVIDGILLSALQLEAIVYASQQHWQWLHDGTRAGFLIGDGAGVGKGRTIAGVIYENYLSGRKKSVWFSVSNDLKYDAMRDLRDIGAGKIEIHSLNKFKYGKISGKANNSIKKGVVFATYPSLIGESSTQETKYNTRLKQLLHWCGDDFEGVIVFDECHKAKNLFPVGSGKPTKTALAVMELQRKLPKARVIYSSATGASEPRNMGYMSRLGIWGPGTQFPVFNDFIQAVEKRGVGAMEMVAMDMKLRGMYLARQLSFGGVTFRIEEAPLEKSVVEAYNGAVRLWVDAREKFQLALNLLDIDKKERKMVWSQFWSAHQRFFKYMCIAAKVAEAVRLSKKALSDGKCVVIGLQSTGEARLMEQVEDAGGELNDFVSTAKGVLHTLITKHFPAPSRQSMAGMSGEIVFTYQPGGASNSRKRKRGSAAGMKAPNPKRPAVVAEGSGSSNGSDSSESESPSKPTVKDAASAASQDESGDDDENSGGSSDDLEDFNPFATCNGEGDPWLSREAHRQKKAKKKKVKTENDTSLESILTSAGLKVKQFGMLSKPSTPVPSPNPPPNPPTLDPFSNKFKSASSRNPSPGNPVETQRPVSSLVPQSFRVEKEPALRVIQMKDELLEEIEELGDKLPTNTLDELIDQLGGPEKVSEMTGRKGRMVSMPDGTVRYESRSRGDVPLEMLNVFERDRFMKGEKYVAIISEAASSGISLQADKRVNNQRRRLHITLELPWSADRAIQQFGRTHRSNQTSAPEYIFLISELAGEQRFASIVAKRLESLGALTHGDRRATESRDLSRFNFDTKYGRFALENTLKAVLGQMPPMVPPPPSYGNSFFNDVKQALIGVGLVVQEYSYASLQDSKDLSNITRFLNRILGITVELQNALFGYFTDTLAAVIEQAKKTGNFDEGILDVGSSGEDVHRQSSEVYEGNTASGIAMTELHTVSVERGKSWEEALRLLHDDMQPQDGFYVSKQERTSRMTAILVKVVPSPYVVVRATGYKPNLGKQLKKEKLEDIEKKYRKVAISSAKPLWEDQYMASLSLCTHSYLRGQCKTVLVGQKCEFGKRQRTYHVLGGSVLSVWSQVESVLASQAKRQSRIQVARLRTSDGGRIVGVLVPESCVERMRQMLRHLSARTVVQIS